MVSQAAARESGNGTIFVTAIVDRAIQTVAHFSTHFCLLGCNRKDHFVLLYLHCAFIMSTSGKAIEFGRKMGATYIHGRTQSISRVRSHYVGKQSDPAADGISPLIWAMQHAEQRPRYEEKDFGNAAQKRYEVPIDCWTFPW